MIILKAYNRPFTLFRCLNKLKECWNIEKHPILIGVDCHDDPVITHQIIDAVESSGIQNLTEVEINVARRKMGCAGNTRNLFTEAFQTTKDDYVIHIEDDHFLSRDCLLFLEKASEISDINDAFAVCTFHRPVHQWWTNSPEDITKCILKHWFDGAGPCAITRKIWDEIDSRGGMFGVDYISSKGRTADCNGEEWLREVNISDKLSWVWPLHKYFRRGRPVIYPKVSRSLNIGRHGLHLNAEAHNNLQYNEDVADSYNISENIENLYDFNDMEFDPHQFLEDGLTT